MRAEEHPDYSHEFNRLQTTIKYVAESLKEAEVRLGVLTKEAQGARKRYRADDNSQDYIDKLVASQMVDHLYLKIQNMESSQKKPYFARVDFLENGKLDRQQLYFGKTSILREDLTPEIVDWRAPVANLYYEGRLGETSYTCPDGEIKGELQLKRQYTIDNAELKEIFDIDITSNDEFLQEYLGANTDKRLKDIVATIQVEQNRIVRAAMDKTLVIQGAAGSGKTTVALHRIAYLIYNYQKFQPESFMIIAPNRLFLNYISGVLPELGVERVKQTTFADLASELIKEKYKLNNPNQRLIRLVENQQPKFKPEKPPAVTHTAISNPAAISMFKSSALFKDMSNRYLDYLETKILPEEDFVAGDQVLYSYDQIKRMYDHDYHHWAFYQRLDQITKHFKKRLKNWRETRAAKIQATCEMKIFKIKLDQAETEERRRVICRVYDEKDKQLQEIEDIFKNNIQNYLKKVPQFSAVQFYKDLFIEDTLFERFIKRQADSGLMESVRSESLENFQSGMIDPEDLAPILLIKHRCYGWNHRFKTRHIAVDEAQDFSVFQYAVLHELFAESTFTVLGDIRQGIFSFRGLADWRVLQEEVFPDSDLLVLEQSYRTTVEIMEAANQALTGFKELNQYQTKPGIRHGEPVQIIPKAAENEIWPDIAAKIKSLTTDHHYQSMAVICKTAAKIPKLLKHLVNEGISAWQITEKEVEYQAGVVVLPSYLAKGLEFDVVFIADADDEQYAMDELDAKLLYVAMTRPLHRLYIYYFKELTPLLNLDPASSGDRG